MGDAILEQSVRHGEYDQGICLWVDDLRNPAAVDENTGEPTFVNDPENWHWAKTITEAIRILATQKVRKVSLDHDITHTMPSGLPSLNAGGDKEAINKLIDIPIACPETYAAVAYYIAAMSIDERPKTVYIHTANPAGAQAMTNILSGLMELDIIRRHV